MRRKIYNIIVKLFFAVGILLIIGTAWMSDVNLITYKQIFIQLVVGLIMTVIGFVGMGGIKAYED